MEHLRKMVMEALCKTDGRGHRRPTLLEAIAIIFFFCNNTFDN